MRRGSPTLRRNPPQKVVSPPTKQKETAKNWNAGEEMKQVTFHIWEALKRLPLLSYHALCVFCKFVAKLVATHYINIVLGRRF